MTQTPSSSWSPFCVQMHVIQVLWFSPIWLPSFVSPFLTFDAASYAGQISLGQTSWGGCSLIELIAGKIDVFWAEGVKCDRWEMQTMADAAWWPDCPCQLGLPLAVLHLGGPPIPNT